jgi:cytochrome b561
MQIENTRQRWGIVQQTLHWVVAAAIAVQLVVGFRMAGLPDGDPGRALLLPLHTTTGLSILALVLFRLYWRTSHPVPKLPDTLTPSEKGLAHATHHVLYALLITIPIVGYLLVSSHGMSIPFFNSKLPAVIGESVQHQRALAGLHFAGAIVLLMVVGLHIAAAMRHAWSLRDGVMERMAPWLRSDGPTDLEPSSTPAQTADGASKADSQAG